MNSISCCYPVKVASSVTRVLLVCYVFGVVHLANASSTAAVDDGTSSSAKIERKGHVSGRTLEHRARLDALGWEIFEPKIPGFEYRYSGMKAKELFIRFGEPTVRSIQEIPHRDPHPDYPYVEIIIWQFPGMLIDVITYPPSETHQPELVLLGRVEISSPQYALKHDLRIGQPVSSFVSLLGNPNRRDDQKIEYLIEDRIELDGYRILFATYQIRIFPDEKNNVRTVLFTWESVH